METLRGGIPLHSKQRNHKYKGPEVGMYTVYTKNRKPVWLEPNERHRR